MHRIRPSRRSMLLLLLPVAGMLLAFRAGLAQDALPDSLKLPVIEQDTLSAPTAQVDSIPDLPPFYDFGGYCLLDDQPILSTINLTGNQARVYSSLRDAVRRMTDFYGLTFGPMGQSFGISYLGLPSYMIDVEPGSPGSYDLYQFPPTGAADYRLYSLEQGDTLRVNRSCSVGSMASIETHRSAFNDSTALADLSIFKGDYSFANTDVIFRQAVGRRFAWGITAGVEQSNGYLRYSSRKERQNYNLDLRWKLNSRWQLRADTRLLDCNDDVAQPDRWLNATAEREVGLRQMNVDAMRSDSAGNRARVNVSYGRFQEKLRSPYFFLRQLHERFSVAGELIRALPPGRLTIIGRAEHDRVTFDPGYAQFMRFRADGSFVLREDSPLSLFAAGHYLFDYGDASRPGAALGASLRSSDCVSSNLTVSIDHTPPSDMMRFLKPRGFDFDFNGADEYAHSGDQSLDPIAAKSVFASIIAQNGGDSISISGRLSRLSDLAVWSDIATESGHLYRAEAFDCNLLSLTASGVMRLPIDLMLAPSYTYCRLSEAESGKNMSVMPRHNVYVALSTEQRIGGLRLDLRPSIEAEYHSINFSNYSNPVGSDAYFIIHFRISAKLKNFTYFYSMENVLNKTHETVYGYPSNRRVCWGIRWLFVN